jgi:hypothetical protein
MAPEWSFLSHHGMVMLALARRPDLRLREIAEIVGISTRATQTIVGDLVDVGVLERDRVGRRNHYLIRGDRALPDPGAADHDVSDLVGALVSGPRAIRPRTGTRDAVALSCGDHRFQEPLRELLAAEGLTGRTEVISWPGGAAALTGPEGPLLVDVLAAAAEREPADRVLLVAHAECHAWTAFDRAGEDPIANLREIRGRRARTTVTVAAAVGVSPETWYLTTSGAHRVGGSRRHRFPTRLPMRRSAEPSS